MPYFNAMGQEVLYSDAYLNGRLRSGFKHIVGDGERVGFDSAFMDAAGSVFLTDAPTPASVSGDHVHDRLLEMTGRTPIPPQPGVQAVADAIAREHRERQLVDEARVVTAVAMYGRSGGKTAQPDDKLAGSKAVRDAVRDAAFSRR